MADVDTEIRSAREARALLDNPVFAKAFTTIESTLIARMKAVPIADLTTQHELVLCLQLLGSVRRYFDEIIDTGKMAEIQKESALPKRRKGMNV